MTDYISKITLPSGSTYYIKDSEARERIEEIIDAAANGVHYLGVTTTPLVDGSHTNPIVIAGENVTAVGGDIVILAGTGGNQNAPKEFIYSSVAEGWQEFGSTGSLKNMAFANTATGYYTPSGTVSVPTFTGTQSTAEYSYTPEGTLSTPTFTGSEMQISGTMTPNGNIAIQSEIDPEEAVNYTPAGSVSQPGFSGNLANFTIAPTEGDSTYTPAGTVSTPNITLTPTTTTVNSIENVGTLPRMTMEVANETLSLDFSAGTLPTKGANQTVVTDMSAASSTPTFSGTGVRLAGSTTPTGTVSTPTFTGTGVTLVGTFTGSDSSFATTATPEGTVSTPIFTGTNELIQATYTPEGTISQPTFTGIQDSVTVEPDTI